MTPIPFVYYMIKGEINQWLGQQHERYGEVVRVMPNQLSYTAAEAQKDIHMPGRGFRHGYDKDPKFYMTFTGNKETPSTFTANEADHERQRRLFQSAFSDRALERQSPILIKYVNMLIDRLRDRAITGAATNILDLYMFITIDTQADLLFGEPFHLTENDKYDPWIASVLYYIHVGSQVMAFMQFVSFRVFWKPILWCLLAGKLESHYRHTSMRVDRRLAMKTPRDDIMKFVLEEGDANPKRCLTTNEIHSNAAHFWLAGSETTTTTLSSVTYHLLKNPDAYKKVCQEIRSLFSSEEDMTMKALGQLRYVDACIKEGQRMHTPVPFPLPRRVPPGGATIAGRFVPAGVTVAVATHAAHRWPTNFTMPNRFIPERWMYGTTEHTPFASDKADASQPFSLGPRGCIGKNMAYFQIRLIIAKIFFNFDMEPLPVCENWDNQKVYGMWEKPPLLVRVTRRRDIVGRGERTILQDMGEGTCEHEG
ncbi:averantin oxidoreductase [Colletotrichum truncatum]|uniref:Averantin oxidoreductase n=1 Tax=Colletotrichum truncatum TaxID=5467 RepID=A0ACC3ZFS9_COLTU|nr:averantin oxidoreductase [Colletotrichum truncatum]KAF6801876.1 averantin oxidoreductase [Colletotrichum truncatum]